MIGRSLVSAGALVQVSASSVRRPCSGGCHGVADQALVPVTMNNVLDGHVKLTMDCLDRVYLHGYLGRLQASGQLVQFLKHRGYPIPSAACLRQIGDSFRRRVSVRLRCGRNGSATCGAGHCDGDRFPRADSCRPACHRAMEGCP